MQDRYAGDIGDYGKFALLKAVEDAGLKLGVNWYKAYPNKTETHDDGKYLIPEKFMSCDLKLAEKLYSISKSDARNIAALQNAGLLKTERFYAADTAPKFKRASWQEAALRCFYDCDIVFLDPDNGLSVKSAAPRSEKSAKYVFIDEIADYIRSGISVIVYNHRQRLKAEIYFASIRQRLEADSAIKGKEIFAVTFPKCTVRDYFIISADEKHSKKIKQALESVLTGPFGESGFCRIPEEFTSP